MLGIWCWVPSSENVLLYRAQPSRFSWFVNVVYGEQSPTIPCPVFPSSHGMEAATGRLTDGMAA